MSDKYVDEINHAIYSNIREKEDWVRGEKDPSEWFKLERKLDNIIEQQIRQAKSDVLDEVLDWMDDNYKDFHCYGVRDKINKLKEKLRDIK